MQTPLQVTFRNMAHSEALAAHLEARAQKLEVVFQRIVSCHVVVEVEGHHQPGHDERYRFSINLGLPGRELIVNHAPTNKGEHENVYVTADRAFDEVERQLGDWVKRLREQRHDAAVRK
jgi:ribosomal subunit interface protein